MIYCKINTIKKNKKLTKHVLTVLHVFSDQNLFSIYTPLCHNTFSFDLDFLLFHIDCYTKIYIFNQVLHECEKQMHVRVAISFIY